MDCCKCNLAVTINQIKCSGFCGKMFHYGCAGVDRVAYNQTLKCPNIMWFCCDCRDLLKNPSFIKLMNNHGCAKIAQQPLIEKLLDEVAYIKQQFGIILDRIPLLVSADVTTEDSASIIAEPTGTIAVLDVSAVTLQSSKSSMPSSFDASQTFAEVVKSPAGNLCDKYMIPPESEVVQYTDTSDSTFAEVLSSVNTSSAAKQVGINEAKNPQHKFIKPICGTRDLQIDFGVKAVAPMLWLHLSKFDPGTVESDILKMAKTCLDTDVSKVFKLVPKHRSIDSMEYVCYKLGIKEELRTKALNPDTWPTGVFIREFTNTNFRSPVPPRVKFWTPTAVNTTSI